MAKLSNTAALVDAPGSASVEHSIRTRAIDNGTIVTTCDYNSRTGEYKESQVFHATPPRIVPGRVSQQGKGGGAGSLSDTMKYLNDKG